MAASQSDLLKSLETKVRHLIFLYQEIQKERDCLILQIEEQKRMILEIKEQSEEWETKYQNLKMAKVISVSDTDSKQTQSKLSRLEREIEKCIALLNE